MLSLRLGISAVLDLTGTAIFRVVRPGLPEPPPRGSRPDPFRAATDTILAAHREVVVQAPGENEVDMPAPDRSEVPVPAPSQREVDMPAPDRSEVPVPAPSKRDVDMPAPSKREVAMPASGQSDVAVPAPNKTGVTLPA
jgi:hypothetical protein